jgi:hypothetical protein
LNEKSWKKKRATLPVRCSFVGAPAERSSAIATFRFSPAG